mmetsp:Transcript_182/g.232  ORF Transcript_182/g.232 Transcript_182/m.232 type:complete len:221 (-) Transcript_182:146-808(-)
MAEDSLAPKDAIVEDAVKPEGGGGASDSDGDNDSEGNGKPGRGKLMQRHKRELKELHERKDAEAKKLTSWAKAKRENQKIKVRAEKRDFEEKYRVLEQELQERQAKELMACGPAPSSESTGMASDVDLAFLDAATAAMVVNETPAAAPAANAEGVSSPSADEAAAAAAAAANAAAATATDSTGETSPAAAPQVPLTKKEKERLKKERFAEIQRQLREETH